jgi:hypothetical protein
MQSRTIRYIMTLGSRQCHFAHDQVSATIKATCFFDLRFHLLSRPRKARHSKNDDRKNDMH